MAALRQPILSLLGHVDHGKTTLLDRIAGSVRAEGEAGGITQHIGAIEVPQATVLRLCEGILPTDRFVVPGLLIIDTPGHRSFETLRRRGGALADLAVLVVDAREGVMPQTRESIQILRREKTPFVVALTKIDLLPGWQRPAGAVRLAEHLERLGADYRRSLDERLYSVAEELSSIGFSAERYDRVSDFTRNVGIVPVSSKFGVGVGELLAVLVGLSQRFLQGELALVTGSGEATILERSDQRGIGPVTSVILYRGTLTVGDRLVVTGRRKPFLTHVRGIYRPAPHAKSKGARAGRLVSERSVSAAAGVYLAANGLEEALPGGLINAVRNDEERAKAERQLHEQSHPVADLSPNGVAIAADTLGSLEALAFECREAQVPIHWAEVGPIHRALVLRMAKVRDPAHRAILAFNAPVLPEAISGPEGREVRIFEGDIMYRVLEEFLKWREERRATLAEEHRQETVHPAKFQVLTGFVFRSSKPAIVGVKVLAGQLRPGVRVMSATGTEVGVLKGLQKDGVSVEDAAEQTELAASIDGPIVGRTLHEGDILYVSVPESSARRLKPETLSESERQVFNEILRIRRSVSPFWGQ